MSKNNGNGKVNGNGNGYCNGNGNGKVNGEDYSNEDRSGYPDPDLDLDKLEEPDFYKVNELETLDIQASYRKMGFNIENQ